MIKGLLSSRTLTIWTGTKIFGYASGSTTTLTDHTTSTSLTKTGAEWLEYIETKTGWQVNPRINEFNIFQEDSNTPNRFKIYNQSLATLLGFVKDTLYSKDANNEIVSTYWGAFKLVLDGSKTDKWTQKVNFKEKKSNRKIDSQFLVGIGPVSDYIETYDNSSFTFESRLIHQSREVSLKQFINYNYVSGVGQTVTQVNIPQLALTTKTLKFGLLDTHFIKDESNLPLYCKFSVIVQEV